ncbi:hypothetical protein [Spirosoma areae]
MNLLNPYLYVKFLLPIYSSHCHDTAISLVALPIGSSAQLIRLPT